jgi:erythromycin esterase
VSCCWVKRATARRTFTKRALPLRGISSPIMAFPSLQPREGEPPFHRFPTMWHNTDVDAFIHWMRQHSAGLDEKRRAGFYGLDIYNMAASIASVLAYLDKGRSPRRDPSRGTTTTSDPKRCARHARRHCWTGRCGRHRGGG